MLCAFYLFDTARKANTFSDPKPLDSAFYHFLALFKIAFDKYLKAKFEADVNVNKYIIKIVEKGEKLIILKIFKFLFSFTSSQLLVANNDAKTKEQIIKFFSTLSSYQKTKDALEDLEITVNDIEDIEIKEGEILFF